MPSANGRRNRRMRKAQAKAQAMIQSDLPISRNPLPLTVFVVNNSINSTNCSGVDSHKSDNSRDKCCVCDGITFGINCFDSTYIEECPTCSFKNPNQAIDILCGNAASGMIEIGELTSLVLEELATKASNFITSKSFDACHPQSASLFHNRSQPQMNQQERDDVIRNVRIAKTVAVTAATVTGYIANGVCSSLWTLGSLLSPVVRGVSKKILSEWNVDEEKAERMVNGGMGIAKAAIITTGSVARGFQQSTGLLASGVCSRLARNYENT